GANRIEHGPSNGVIILDARDVYFHDNVIVGFETGLYVNDRGTAEIAGSRYSFVHNTIAEIATEGLTMFGTVTVGNVGKNNLFADIGGNALNKIGRASCRERV